MATPRYVGFGNYLHTINQALVTNGTFDAAYKGRQNQVVENRVVILESESERETNNVPYRWYGTYEIYVATSIVGEDKWGNTSEPGSEWLADVVRENYATNLKKRDEIITFNFSKVQHTQRENHPNRVSRIVLEVEGFMVPDSRGNAGGGGVIVAPNTYNLNDLSDVTTSGPASGEVIKYNGSEWVNDTDSTGTTIDELNDIGDVSAGSPSTNSVLHYSGGTTWVPTTNVTIENATSGVPLNIPELTADPVSPVPGDMWIVDEGTVYLKYVRPNSSVIKVALSA